MLSAGSCVEWLRDDLGMLTSADESAAIAAACHDTGDVWFVPALLGMGTPVWDFGARGTLLGVTRGTGRPELVRAVLEGVAHRGADLLEAAESDSGYAVDALRIDGGMSSNPVFVNALAGPCRSHGCWRRRRWVPASSPGWLPAPGGTRRMSPTPTLRAARSNRREARTSAEPGADAGWKRAPGPPVPSPSSPG
jgi:hypothetical protein